MPESIQPTVVLVDHLGRSGLDLRALGSTAQPR